MATQGQITSYLKRDFRNLVRYHDGQSCFAAVEAFVSSTGLVLSLLSCLGLATHWLRRLVGRSGWPVLKITPSSRYSWRGYAGDRPFASVHDDLFAKALVLVDEQGTHAVLVTTDLIGLTAEIADPIRERVEKQTGIPASSIMLSSSHTHTGPTLSLDPMPRDGRTLADTERTVAYTRRLQDKLVNVVVEAAKERALRVVK
jgi:hypothetical protein